MNETCLTEIRGGDVWHSRVHPCGRPAKGTLKNGDPACGVHLRQERVAAEASDARTAWNARIAAVNDALGIRCFGFELDRPVSVRLEDLESLADRLRVPGLVESP